jgi:hypothetical protein
VKGKKLMWLIILGILITFKTVPVNAWEPFPYGHPSNDDAEDLRFKVDTTCDYYTMIKNAAVFAGVSYDDLAYSGCPFIYLVTSGGYFTYVTHYYDDDWTLAYVLPNGGPPITDECLIFVNEWVIEQNYYEEPEHLQWVLCHEWGHVLGLGHEKDLGARIIMWDTDLPYLDYGIYEPTSDEEDGLEDIYS